MAKLSLLTAQHRGDQVLRVPVGPKTTRKEVYHWLENLIRDLDPDLNAKELLGALPNFVPERKDEPFDPYAKEGEHYLFFLKTK